MSPAPEPAEPAPESAAERRAAVVRTIHEAGASASSPLEVYRAALAGVTPLVGASFASVFLRDEDAPHLLRLACAQNWPQRSARFLSEIRIREGRGPTGQAVAQAAPIEVVDVFEDPDLEEWWEPARELGFTAMTAHPLMADGRAVGSISFYFSDSTRLNDEARSLLATAAREMADAALEVDSA